MRVPSWVPATTIIIDRNVSSAHINYFLKFLKESFMQSDWQSLLSLAFWFSQFSSYVLLCTGSNHKDWWRKGRSWFPEANTELRLIYIKKIQAEDVDDKKDGPYDCANDLTAPKKCFVDFVCLELACVCLKFPHFFSLFIIGAPPSKAH